MTAVEELRAENARLRCLLAGDLPLELDGKPVRWEPWEACPTWITHVDVACPECADRGASDVLGRSASGIREFWAIRCHGCKFTVAYRRVPRGRAGRPHVGLVEVWRNRGQGELF